MVILSSRSKTYNSTLSVVLALMVFNYGTHLAPQLAMGPESIAYKGIEVEGYRDFLWIKRSSRVTTGYQSRVMMVARSMLGMDVYNGLMWLPRAPLRAAKMTFRALHIPYKCTTNGLQNPGVMLAPARTTAPQVWGASQILGQGRLRQDKTWKPLDVSLISV